MGGEGEEGCQGEGTRGVCAARSRRDTGEQRERERERGELRRGKEDGAQLHQNGNLVVFIVVGGANLSDLYNE